MPTNIEFKAYCPSLENARKTLDDLGAELMRSVQQVDTYFYARQGTLKLRESSGVQPFLISYSRLNAPTARASEYCKATLGPDWTDIKAALTDALGLHVVVMKRRETYRHKAALIHLDEVDNLGSFLEVEVEVEQADSPVEAAKQAAELQRILRVTAASIVPWSYSDLITLRDAAARWRAQLAAKRDHGKIFLIDGASGSGKSTMLTELLAEFSSRLHLVPRVTTREPRSVVDIEHSHMQFVPASTFRRMVLDGELIEYRDFLFGMSYGLPWEPTIKAALAGQTVVGLINLGNGPHLKRFFPEARTILVDAPLEDIRKRLSARGVHTPDQLEERVSNAETAKQYALEYDHVIFNQDGRLSDALELFRSLLI